MAASAVFCAPARYEPFGLAPLEAAAAGCALVLGDIGSLREVWEDAALFVEPDDPERLIAALTAALEDHVALGARALRQAARYTSARMAEEYADAYERLVTERITAPADARA
jgi:glycosyltransferase involved in cell wall biosynthesis